MNRIILFLLALSLRATPIYFGSAGNDTTGNGTLATPYKTFNRTLYGSAPINVCGGTIIDIADGNYVSFDANLPSYANCNLTTNVESSKWNMFAPVGYRTNPVLDASNYGKGQVTTGIVAQALAEAHGNGGGAVITMGGAFVCIPLTVIGDFINPYCGTGVPIPDLANGTQIEFELAQSDSAQYTMPTNLVFQQKYQVCNKSGNTFQVCPIGSSSPITGITCSMPCNYGNVLIGTPLGVNTSTSTFTNSEPSTFPFGAAYANGLPVSLSVGGQQFFGTYPAPLLADTPYYICNFNSGAQTFQLGYDAGCSSLVTITSAGTGALAISGNIISSNWAFRGLEIEEGAGGNVFGYIQIGTGGEASQVLGAASHFELDHMFIHQIAGSTTPSTKGVVDNGRFVSIHDSWIGGFLGGNGEAQGVNGCAAIGPTNLSNNFIEAGGENSLYGGCAPISGASNRNHLFAGNYFFKPSYWKVSLNTMAGWQQYTGASFVPTGNCLYSTDDPFIPGGEWYFDGPMSQWYECGADFAWHATASTPYNCGGGTTVCGNPAFKDLAEHKNGSHFTYTGNLLNNSWARDQQGEAWNDSAEAGSGAGMADDNIVLANNAVFNVYQPLVRVNQCNGINPNIPCLVAGGNHLTQNDLFVITPAGCGVHSGSTVLVACNGVTGAYAPNQFSVVSFVAPLNDVFNHVTVSSSDTGWQAVSTPAIRVTSSASDSVCTPAALVQNARDQNSILFGDYWYTCAGTTTPDGIGAFYNNSTFSYNAMKAGTNTMASYVSNGTNNFDKTHMAFPVDNTVIKYVNASASSLNPMDFCLASNSPYSAQNVSATLLANDGTNLGTDCQMVAMMTSGARLGTPNWDAQAHLFYDIGSTSIVIRYTAQNPGACTATLYNAPARISANQVASVVDSAASSVQNGIDRNLLITGLTPGAIYYPIVAGTGCPNALVGTGNGVVSFTTRAAGSGTTNFPFQWSAATAMRYSADPTFMSGVTSLSAATVQPVPVTHGTPIYAQVGTTGPTTILIVP